MVRLTRRGFLLSSATTAATVAFSGTGCPSDPPRFRHGVASGDPLSDRVILWTRVTVPSLPASVTVNWKLALDPFMLQVVQSGSVLAVPGSDYTVKLDVTGLSPNTTYYYQFDSGTWHSPVGRTRTFPAAGDVSAVQARFAVISCLNYLNGFFNGCGRIAARADLDAVVCIGDYIYAEENGVEGDGTSINRVPVPNVECVTLADYRARHAQQKTDPQLQEMHRQHPFIGIWDDHEFINNTYKDGASSHDPGTEGDWCDRMAAAVKAYYEWLPIREIDPVPVCPTTARPQIFRSFQYGDLLDLILLDARLFRRDEEALAVNDGPNYDVAATGEVICDASREMIGPTQESFLQTELSNSVSRSASWQIVGNQVILSPLLNLNPVDDPVDGIPNDGPLTIFNPDQWDGYEPARQRVMDKIETYGENVIVLTGDVHTSWVFEVQRDPDAQAPGRSHHSPCGISPSNPTTAIAAEFVGPAISSAAIDDPLIGDLGASGLLSTQPHLKAVDLVQAGYVLLDVTPSRVQADFMYTGNRRIPSNTDIFGGGWQVFPGSSVPMSTVTPIASLQRSPQLAPDSLIARWLRDESDVRLDWA